MRTKMQVGVIAMVAALLVMLAAGQAAAQTPAQWVAAFWPAARAAGVSQKVYQAALGNFTPDPDVLKRAAAQAEFNMPLWAYLDQMVSDDRLAKGKAALAADSSLLARIEQRYGVDRYVVLAIWGIESHYGAALTNARLYKQTIPALATLAYSGGRLAKYGRTQLVAALRILQRGDVSLAGMTGSWAGAMGQTQFIPTTFEAYAVDFDGDGRRNIWTSNADALASTANYLHISGWRPGETWGYEVTVPAGFDAAKVGAHPISWWARRGFVRANGAAFPRPGDVATLFAPTVPKPGPAFLLLPNFRAIKHYNNANSYALAVGHLADRLRGGGDFAQAWPDRQAPLSDDMAQRLQLALTMAGYYDGPIDGNLGSGTRDAIRSFQRDLGITADGIPSLTVLQQLEGPQQN
jgi:membrane-bound lytic murein transglycosylase B